MSLPRAILAELAAMFWADRRLNLGLIALTALAFAAGQLWPVLREGVLPVAFALGVCLVFARCLAPTSPEVESDRAGPHEPP